MEEVGLQLYQNWRHVLRNKKRSVESCEVKVYVQIIGKTMYRFPYIFISMFEAKFNVILKEFLYAYIFLYNLY